MRQRLGILVNSLNYFDHVIEISRAAIDKDKQVRIHLALQGIFLMEHKAFDELNQIANVSVCQVSVASQGLLLDDEDGRRDLLADPSKLSEVIANCDRCVAF